MSVIVLSTENHLLCFLIEGCTGLGVVYDGIDFYDCWDWNKRKGYNTLEHTVPLIVKEKFVVGI